MNNWTQKQLDKEIIFTKIVAPSEMEEGRNMQLEVSITKGLRKGTIAAIACMYHVNSMSKLATIFQDFRETIAITPCARVTGKALQIVSEDIKQQLNDVEERAKAHYGL